MGKSGNKKGKASAPATKPVEDELTSDVKALIGELGLVKATPVPKSGGKSKSTTQQPKTDASKAIEKKKKVLPTWGSTFSSLGTDRKSEKKNNGDAPGTSKRRRDPSSTKEEPRRSAMIINKEALDGTLGKGEDEEPWYELVDAGHLRSGHEAPDQLRLMQSSAERMRSNASELLAKELEAYGTLERQREREDSDWQFTRKVLTSGTLSDKVAAMALVVSDDPMHNMNFVDQLLAMAKKKGRREASMAVEALKDLFLHNLLPDRRLVSFESRDFGATDTIQASDLVMWLYEDELKSKYMDFVQSVEQASFDNLEYFKRSMVKTLFELLEAKPELEQMLLTSVINKLGDPERKVASQVVHLLKSLVKAHPNMRPVVAREVERIIHRPNVSKRCVYYGIVYLNQLVLRRDDDLEFARELIRIYFALFRQLAGRKALDKEEDEEVLADATKVEDEWDVTTEKEAEAQAIADAKGKDGDDEDDEQGIETPVHAREQERADKEAGHKNKGPKHDPKKGKKKHINKDKDGKVIVGDAESKLLSALLTGINRAFPYADSQGKEFEEQVDGLFEMVHVGSFAASTQALSLLLQVMKSRNAVSDRFYRALYVKMLVPELLTSSKQTLFLNVLFKAVKSDDSATRQKAFAKRLIQVALMSPAHLAAGLLFLVSTMAQAIPHLLVMIHGVDGAAFGGKLLNGESKPVTGKAAIDDDLSSDEEEEEEEKNTPTTDMVIAKPNATVVNDDDLSEDEEDMPPTQDQVKEGEEQEKEQKEQEEEKSDAVDAVAAATQAPATDSYDDKKREPLFAGADASTRLWEMDLLAKHYHPSVQRFASAVLTDPESRVNYQGDPLRDLSLAAFLDRFVYRNPKKDIASKLRTSVFGMQGGSQRKGQRVLTAAAVNSSQFAALDGDNVLDSEQFFHRFFQERSKTVADRKSGDASKDGDEESEDGDSEDEIDKYAQKLAEKMMDDHEKTTTGRKGSKGKVNTDGKVDPDDLDIDYGYSSDEADDDDDDDDDSGFIMHNAKGVEVDVDNEDEDSDDDGEAALFASAEMSDSDDDGAEPSSPGGSFESDEEGSLDEGEDDDDDGSESDEDQGPLSHLPKAARGKLDRFRASNKSAGKYQSSSSSFAAAEDFSMLLENAGESDAHPKQAAWEARNDGEAKNSGNKKKNNSKGSSKKRNSSAGGGGGGGKKGGKRVKR